MNSYIRLLRPQQWVKNLFVVLPLFFGGELFDVPSLLSVLITTAVFCLVASSVYCYNDIVDVDDDRRHPRKCHRPVASGAISVPVAYLLMGLTAVLAGGLTFLLDGGVRTNVQFTVLVYYLMNLCYCSRLKQLAIIDVCIVAFGFVLRVLAGGFAADVETSKWIVLMTFLLTLFMSLGKRRDDVLRMKETGRPTRKNTARYNLDFINQSISITATVTLVCYIMYTVSPEVSARFDTPYLYLTSAFVLLGLLRYMQISLVDEKSGNPTRILLHDHFTQAVVVGWGLTFLLMIYVL